MNSSDGTTLASETISVSGGSASGTTTVSATGDYKDEVVELKVIVTDTNGNSASRSQNHTVDGDDETKGQETYP